MPRRLCLITCAVLTTVLWVSSTGEATQPRMPHPNPMVTKPQGTAAQMQPGMQPRARTKTERRSFRPALMLLSVAEADGLEPAVPLGALAFKVVDPAISDDHPSSMGRS